MTDTTEITTGLTESEAEADVNAAEARTDAATEPPTYLPVKKVTVQQLHELLGANKVTYLEEDRKRALYDRALAAKLLTDQKPEPTEPAAKPEPEGSGAEPEAAGIVVPETYTVADEVHYSQVAAKFGIANYRELGALNGVKNSRYELSRGDVVQLPAPKRG